MATRYGDIPELIRASTVDEAAAELARLGEDGEVIAGGTWVMLGPLYRRPTRMHYVAVGHLEELRHIDAGGGSIGAAATHTDLAALDGELAVLAQAARGTPTAIGNVATVAGNLCASPYPAADLVPALLVLDATVEVAAGSERSELPLSEFLAGERPQPGTLVTRCVTHAPTGSRSRYERLTVRRGGEEAVASVALSVDFDGEVVASARVAFGSVEELSARCPQAEQELTGKPLSEESAAAAGEAVAAQMEARDGLDAPGWYRLKVLPALVKRAARQLTGS
ncbi:MAG: FAD binding domain-containing protein [Actinomycetia bacterium]|nr:FAD binding domain-containing protein [Actinomycetes bacterium]